MPILVGFAGLAIDYSRLYSQRSNMQNAVDSAALTAAMEMALSNSSEKALISTVKNYVLANSGEKADSVEISVKIDFKAATLEVTVSKVWNPMVLQYIDATAFPIIVKAKARLKGTSKICMIGLSRGRGKTVLLATVSSTVSSNCFPQYIFSQ